MANEFQGPAQVQVYDVDQSTGVKGTIVHTLTNDDQDLNTPTTVEIQSQYIELFNQTSLLPVLRRFGGQQAILTSSIVDTFNQDFLAVFSNQTKIADGTTPENTIVVGQSQAGLLLKRYWVTIVPYNGAAIETDPQKFYHLPFAQPLSDSIAPTFSLNEQSTYTYQFTSTPSPLSIAGITGAHWMLGDESVTP